MTFEVLLAWILALPGVPDSRGYPIARPRGAASVIAKVAMETELPVVFASYLDVLAARESGYRVGAVGDGGLSCGAWQTPCSRTPSDAMGQARLAVRVLRQALDVCPEHVLWAYAAGRCTRTHIATVYEDLVRAEMAQHPE